MNGHFMTTSGHFLATYMFILHKTEIQTIILRCLMRLNLNWFKSNDAKPKNPKNTNLCFCTKSKKNQKFKYLPFATSEAITFEPIKI